MKILSIDTSSDICGISILENNELLINQDCNTGRTHSENLMPLVQETLSKANFNLKDIDLLVCDKGPGSFTGIRIGIATCMAFHDSLNIPLIGISSLESLAYNTLNIKDSSTTLICSIIDCKNNNCYFSLFEKSKETYNCLISPQAEDIDSCLAIIQSYIEDNYDEKKEIAFVGDGSEIYKDIIKKSLDTALFVDSTLNIINSYSLGLAGLNKYNNNEPSDYLPLYLKKPQAQRQLEDKLSKLNN